MNEIQNNNYCEKHNRNISIICLNKNCKNRFLCLKCLRNHEISHSPNYVPKNELIYNNNIILFDEYKKENMEKENNLLNIKKDIKIEINKIIEDFKNQIENKINEIFNKKYPIYENINNINNLSLNEISNLYENINKENNEIKFNIEIFKNSIKNKLSNIVQNLNIDIFEDNSKLKKIESGTCELDYGGSYGRILFDINTDEVYYIEGLSGNKINVYDNYDNFKSKKLTKTINISSKISGTYSVIHKGFFYFFEYKSEQNTNKLIKYDLKQNKIIKSQTILSDAILGNSQNCWGGYNDIILISNNKYLYAVYSSNNNNKRISIALINEDNLNVIKIWNTDSLEKKQCGPIFMINNYLYHIKTYNNENDSVIYSYDLLNGKSNKINIPFENKGGYDTSLTYYPHLKCLMTVNKSKIYKYNITLED